MAGTHEDGKMYPLLRGGASIVTIKPIFSWDGKFVICCSGDVIKVLSVSSGLCVHRLRGHRDAVTSIIINPYNQYQLISCGLDKKLIKWDYCDGVLLKKYELEHSFVHILSTSDQSQTIYAVQQSSYRKGILVKVYLPKLNETKVKTEQIQVVSGKLDNQYSIGCKGKVFACISGRKLQVITLIDGISIEHKLPNENESFTCLACHPTESSLITGVSTGNILVWHNFLKDQKPVKTSHHWHALPVSDITFTQEGTYYLSGGHECVLVKWQYNSHNRDTLPRLGSQILKISCSRDNALYATCHADNSIQVISSNFKVLQVFQGLTRSTSECFGEASVPTGLLLDPRSKSLVLNGRPGHLQFYSLQDDQQLYNLDIVCQNYISPENLKRPLYTTEIENAAFSDDGLWLATLERRDDHETTPDVRLKFWAYDEKRQQFVLNTNVDHAHSEEVTCLKFRPPVKDTALMLVTASSDGKFKTWSLVDDTDIYRKNSCWTCESVGFYRNLPAGKADFSEDGSVLLVVFGSVITLWDPDTNALRTTLNHGIDQSGIQNVLFGKGEWSHIFMTVTEKYVYAWNILTCSVLWQKSMKVQILVQSPISHYIAAFTSRYELYVFKPDNPEPIYHHPNAAASQSVSSAIFIPCRKESDCTDDSEWQSKDRLYYLTNSLKLMTLGEHNDEADSPSDRTGMMVQNLPKTPFSILMSDGRKTGVKDIDVSSTTQKLGQPGAKFLHDMLGAPAHTLPPVSSLCMTFMDSLMIKKKSYEEEDNDESDEEPMEVEEVSSDSDVEDGSHKGNSPSTENAKSLSKKQPEYRKLKPKLFKWIQKMQ